MKNNIVIIILALMSLSIYSCQQDKSSFKIDGEISGLPDSSKVILVPGGTHKEERPIAGTYVTEGKFTIEGKIDEPRIFLIQVEKSFGSFPIVIENGNVRIKGSAELSDSDGVAVVQFSDIVVDGSRPHHKYLQIMSYKDSLNRDYDAYQQKHKSIMDRLKQARMTKNQDALDSLFETPEYRKLAEDEKAFFDNVRATTENAILNEKDSWWGPLTMLMSMSYFTENEQVLYDSFSEEAKNSYYGRILHKELFPERMQGKTVPHFELSDQAGEAFQLGFLMEGKKYTLVDFWASWCAPCRKEIPNLKRLYSEFSPKGFQIISVSIDREKADWMKALDEENMPWPNLWDSKDVDTLFMVKTIPAMFLIDENGTIVADNLRGEELHQKIQQLLK